MAGKSNTSATFFAQKKLLGKAHTSNLKTDGEELIGSNIQAATNLIFGEKIPTSPAQTLFLTSSVTGSNSSVEYIQFTLTALTGTTYDANNSNPDGGAGSDAGESGQSSGPHTYKFVFPSDYEVSSSNSRRGNGSFDNNVIVHHTLGAVQLVPPFFSQAAPNPYIVKVFEDNGSGGVGDEIPLLDNIDWNVDFYNGVLFLQDYDANKIPAFARAFVYIGKMAEEVISSGSGGGSGTPAGANTQVQFNDNGSFGASSAFTFNSTEIGLHADSPTISIRRTNNNQNSDIDFKGTGGVTGARLRLSGSASNDLILSTFTGATVKERIRVGSNLSDVFIDVTGSLRSSLGISGSLTQLPDGTSYLKAGTNITIVSESNGAVTVSATPGGGNGNYVFNEYLGLANGANTFFALDNTPTAAKNVSVFVNGQLQMPATSITSAPFQDYSITGSNVFFASSSIPPIGSLLMANYTTNDAI